MANSQSDIRYGNNQKVLADIQGRIKHVFVLMLENRADFAERDR